MKRLICMMLLIAMALSLAACGSEKSEPAGKIPENTAPTEAPAVEEPEVKTEEYYYGTWAVVGIIRSEEFYTVEALIEKGADESLRDTSLILNADGEYYFTGKIGTWRINETGIVCNGTPFELVEDRLTVTIEKENYDIVFEKTSDSQEFPEPPAEPETEELTGIRPEFKEAMDAIEAFYDEYFEFMQKYMKNPTDMSLLSKYMGMVSELSEMEQKLAAWSSEDMSDEELAYYIDLTARIEKKLIGLL